MDGQGLQSEPSSPNLHGSSVGEASARQISHCPPASKDVRQGRPETPGLRVSLRWLRSSDLSRRAVLKLQPVGGIRKVSLAIVGHFFRSGGNGFLFPLLSFDSPQKGLWNRTTISLRVMEDAAWKFRWFARLSIASAAASSTRF